MRPPCYQSAFHLFTDMSQKGKRYKGRRCASKVSLEFRLMEADLYNVQPAIGEVNGRRSNYSMAIIPGENANLVNVMLRSRTGRLN